MKKLVPVLLLGLLFLAGCYPGAPITCTAPDKLPAINSFSASPASISAGESSSLNWTVSGATAVSIDQGIGNVALTGPRAVAPSVTTVYTLTASSTAGSVTATTQVIVSGATPTPAGLPVINSFNASSSGISLGDSTTLSWSVSNATSVTIDNGVGAVGSSGSTTVLPSASTTFTLTASNAAGSDTATALVIVSGVPSPGGFPDINIFTANPPGISSGGSTVLSWDVSNATSVTIDNGVGPVGSVGSTTVSPSSSTNYTLTATNAAGSYYMTIAVLVTEAPPIADTTPPTVPSLLSPASGAILLQKTAPWSFSWADSSDSESGIKQYQIQVYREGQPPFLDKYVTVPTYSEVVEVAYPYLSDWRWKVRAQNNDGLWSAWSAVRTFNVEPRVFYDFVDKAMSAAWKNGAFTDLGFGIVQNDGFARYHTNQKLDDGNTYTKVLETHPQWVNHGSIEGMYPAMTVPAGAKFVAKFGFLDGANATDGALFRLTWRESGSMVTVSLGGKTVTYGGPIKTLDVDLSSYAGKTGQFGLQVEAGASSGQDWATWAEAKMIY